MKRLIVTHMMMMMCLMSHSKDMPKVTFGTEWGYSASLLTGYHYNFFDPEGFRVDIRSLDLSYWTNGEVSFHLGYNINELWNIALYAGYAGAGKFHPVVPISIRTTRYLGDSWLKDRWFVFWELGSGVCLKNPKEIYTGKLGGGYRLSLSRRTKMDFIVAARTLYTHPEILHYGEYIPERLINRNDGYVSSLFLGISLTF